MGEGQSLNALSGQSLPWTYSFDSEKGEPVSVSGVNEGNSGSVIVKIFVDGEEFKSSMNTGTSGSFNIILVQGTLP